MTTVKVTEEALSLYAAWLHSRGYHKREGQERMIRFVCETLGAQESPIGVIEAGTGTGKTAAFCSAAIAHAQQYGFYVVIVTATVPLQDQITKQELPELAALTNPSFRFTIAKGRQRYACLDRMARLDREYEQMRSGLIETTIPTHLSQVHRLNRAFSARDWDGDMDAAPDQISYEIGRLITTDTHGCLRSLCEHRPDCPFFEARDRVRRVDVVVTNYDLLLRDLVLQLGILPPPDRTIYILDEAHVLYQKAMDSFTRTLGVSELKTWSEDAVHQLAELAKVATDQDAISVNLSRALEQAQVIAPLVDNLTETISAVEFDESSSPRRFRFRFGQVNDELTEAIAPLLDPCRSLLNNVQDVYLKLSNVQGSDSDDWLEAGKVVDFISGVSRLAADGRDALALLEDWFGSEQTSDSARWITEVSPNNTFQCTTVPMQVEYLLDEAFWQQARGVICTSATLCTTDGFDHFIRTSGLPRDTAVMRIESPFDFARMVKFRVPELEHKPDQDAFMVEIAELIPELVQDDVSALVIFNARAMLQGVVSRLPGTFRELCLIQEDYSRHELVAQHRRRIQLGKPSYLFGLASFREGIDLPDELCRHVIITRLPFAVPSDPVFKAREERMLDEVGSTYEVFKRLQVTEATLRLTQACGRLIRHENDFGKITILDRRIVEKRYGRKMLKALPPYSIELS